jgi:(p)ppGpp synthase/HD superfamily hydrolase
MNELVEKAKVYATQIHARINHQCKYSNKPYDVHLKQVAELVAEVSDDPEMLAAAWLHDTVEDTPATLLDIEREFGPDVARLVSELTDVSRPGDGKRAYRKRLDLEHLAGASNRAKTVKLADLIDNCRDICNHDRRFARVYLAEMRDLLGVLDTGDETLLLFHRAAGRGFRNNQSRTHRKTGRAYVVVRDHHHHRSPPGQSYQQALPR